MIDSTLLFNFLDSNFSDSTCSLLYQKDYELLIAIMLSAQTTDKAVNKATSILFKKYNNLESLSKADIEDIENIISFLGMYKIKSKNIVDIANRLVRDYDGQVPLDENDLLSLPGIGNKTKNCFLAEWAHLPFLAVDTHVSRISKRLAIAKENDDVLTIEKKLIKYIPSDRLIKTGHQLIDFGRSICKAKNPRCKDCALSSNCHYFLSLK